MPTKTTASPFEYMAIRDASVGAFAIGVMLSGPKADERRSLSWTWRLAISLSSNAQVNEFSSVKKMMRKMVKFFIAGVYTSKGKKDDRV